ncbi:hypothetical protein B0I37DRAFT_19641 [Chaetomium sp. MPI-CAGE-AT-0009]|nr:hypothetical protein B0I37DRAFT_19641 [Chaetomium sp. MPI-CAGE-AT-0009]
MRGCRLEARDGTWHSTALNATQWAASQLPSVTNAGRHTSQLACSVWSVWRRDKATHRDGTGSVAWANQLRPIRNRQSHPLVPSPPQSGTDPPKQIQSCLPLTCFLPPAAACASAPTHAETSMHICLWSRIVFTCLACLACLASLILGGDWLELISSHWRQSDLRV